MTLWQRILGRDPIQLHTYAKVHRIPRLQNIWLLGLRVGAGLFHRWEHDQADTVEVIERQF